MNLKDTLHNLRVSGNLPATMLINTNEPDYALNELKEFLLADYCIDLDLFHRDLFVIKPSENGKINIEQIRDLKNFLQQTADLKLAVIYQAEKMNIYCFNACLKFLEEAPGNTKIFLIASNIADIPATVKSRCYGLRKIYQIHEWNDEYQKLIFALSRGDLISFIEEQNLKMNWESFATNVQLLLSRLLKYQMQNLSDAFSDEELLFKNGSTSIDCVLELFNEVKLLLSQAVEYELERKAVAYLVLDLVYECFSN